MFTKVIIGACIVFALFFVVSSLPVYNIKTNTGKIYQLVPLQIHSDQRFHSLERKRRDVFSDNLNNQKTETNGNVGTNQEITLERNKDENQVMLKGGKREILQTASDTVYPIVYRIRREHENRRRYEESDDAYTDSDYAGYDRKGSEVGYMDDNDDFPTVVW